MQNTIQQTNKSLVLEAFDTLFNKRDYSAAERYWSPNYIQHTYSSDWVAELTARYNLKLLGQ